MKEKLIISLEDSGCADPEGACGKFLRYMDLVLEFNKSINLTAVTDPDEFILKHFIDSLTCSEIPGFEDVRTVIDVGTGSGFPGLVLAAAFPEKNFVLLDSLKKRLNILDQIMDEIGVNNAVTLHSRAEDAAKSKEYREKFDLAVARAVAPLGVLCEYCLPFVRKGGHFAAMKSSSSKEEISFAANAIGTLGGKVECDIETSMKGFGFDHRIILLKKERPTPSKYPRKAGTPSKEPL